jgi:hypothetical protein
MTNTIDRFIAPPLEHVFAIHSHGNGEGFTWADGRSRIRPANGRSHSIRTSGPVYAGSLSTSTEFPFVPFVGKGQFTGIITEHGGLGCA